MRLITIGFVFLILMGCKNAYHRHYLISQEVVADENATQSADTTPSPSKE